MSINESCLDELFAMVFDGVTIKEKFEKVYREEISPLIFSSGFSSEQLAKIFSEGFVRNGSSGLAYDIETDSWMYENNSQPSREYIVLVGTVYYRGESETEHLYIPTNLFLNPNLFDVGEWLQGLYNSALKREEEAKLRNKEEGIVRSKNQIKYHIKEIERLKNKLQEQGIEVE